MLDAEEMLVCCTRRRLTGGLRHGLRNQQQQDTPSGLGSKPRLGSGWKGKVDETKLVHLGAHRELDVDNVQAKHQFMHEDKQ